MAEGSNDAELWAALRASEARYRTLVEHAQDAIISTDEQFKISAWNRGAERLYGWSADEVMGKLIATLFDHEYVGTTSEEVQRQMLSESGYWRGTSFNKRKDGTTVVVNSTTSALKNDSGGIIGFMVIQRDDTEVARTREKLIALNETLERSVETGTQELVMQNEELRRALDRLRIHVEHTPLGVIEWDTDFRVVAWNARCEEIFGFTKEEALGRFASELLVPPELHDAINQVFSDLLAQTGGSQSTNENVTKDGRVITCEWNNTTLLDADDKPIGVASICQDITVRKELQSQILMSQKMQAIGTLAGGVAHDINNVLAVVIGLGSVVVDELPNGSDLQVDMQEILAAAERGSSMVTNLLGFARQGTFSSTKWSPKVAIEGLVELLEKTIPKSIQIRADLSEPLDHIVGDVNQITTAFMNLCINASQAISGHGRILIAASNFSIASEEGGDYSQLEPGRYVKISVADDGRGMDDETRKRVFEPFFTTKGVGEGTGLGLSMVYGAIESHGGSVSIESNLGAGTRVSIVLPSSEPDAQVTDQRSEAKHAGAGHILVIDDEAMILRTAKRVLEALGYRVTVAEGASSGIEQFCSGEYDFNLVLLDFSMPGMNGAECFRQLLKADPEVRVLICTGHSDPRLTEKMMAAGAKGVLNKPFDRNEVARLVSATLS